MKLVLLIMAVTAASTVPDPDNGRESAAENRCGPNALAICSAALQHPISETKLLRLIPPSDAEATLMDLQSAAQAVGLSARGVHWRSELPELRFGETPAILPIVARNGRPHFIALLAHIHGRVCLLDDPRPPAWITVDKLRQDLHWNGWALHVAAADADLQRLPVGVSFVWWCAAFALAAIFLLASARLRRRSGPLPDSTPTGFTIIELLVVLAIVSLLVALTAPAIMGARESSRKMDCAHRMRQMLLAAQNYESRFGCWPPSTVPYFGNPPIYGSDGQQISHRQNLSFHVHVLPDLEHADLHRKINPSELGSGQIQFPVTSHTNSEVLHQRVVHFECPSDFVPAGGTSYRVCADKFRLGRRLFLPFVRGLRDKDWPDGRSQTISLGERSIGDMDQSRYSPDRDVAVMGIRLTPLDTPDQMAAACRRNSGDPLDHASHVGSAWLYSGFVHTWYNHVLPPNSTVPDCVVGPVTIRGFYDGIFPCAVSARSLHRGGVNSGLADGSVRFISENVDLQIWQALATRAGGESVSAP
jgi:prepilin-type N-terminal cleavage/methylation domain-containing protein